MVKANESIYKKSGNRPIAIQCNEDVEGPSYIAGLESESGLLCQQLMGVPQTCFEKKSCLIHLREMATIHNVLFDRNWFTTVLVSMQTQPGSGSQIELNRISPYCGQIREIVRGRKRQIQ